MFDGLKKEKREERRGFQPCSMTCSSRARRFGKIGAHKMLTINNQTIIQDSFRKEKKEKTHEARGTKRTYLHKRDIHQIEAKKQNKVSCGKRA